MDNKMKRIMLFSDSHGLHSKIDIPDNIDIAIFAGDAGTFRDKYHNERGILDFIEWYSALPNIKNKIWIAGNHCTSIEAGLVNAKLISQNKGLIYLEHESCEVEGIKIFGSPYTPSFGVGWAYNVPRQNLRSYWDEIPLDTEFLVSHGPPYGIGDYVIYNGGEHVGCKELLNVITTKLTNLKLNVFGHIHYSYGYEIKDNVIFANASVVDEDYQVVNKPILIDFNLGTREIIIVE